MKTTEQQPDGDIRLERSDMEQHHVVLGIEVSFTFDTNTPEEVKRELTVLAMAMHEMARNCCRGQLRFHGLTPTSEKELLRGKTEQGTGILQESNWHGV